MEITRLVDDRLGESKLLVELFTNEFNELMGTLDWQLADCLWIKELWFLRV